MRTGVRIRSIFIHNTRRDQREVIHNDRRGNGMVLCGVAAGNDWNSLSSYVMTE